MNEFNLDTFDLYEIVTAIENTLQEDFTGVYDTDTDTELNGIVYD